MAYAAVRIRGTTLARQEVIDTLTMLRLGRANHCVILPSSSSVKGMLVKVQNYVTWGEVTPQFIAKLLLKRGSISGRKPLTDKYVKENSNYSSIWDFAQAVAKNQGKFQDVKGLNPVLRLSPPRKGYRSVKLPFSSGGDLGDRGKEIENLLARMMGGTNDGQ